MRKGDYMADGPNQYEVHVKLVGVRDLMLNPYPGENSKKLDAEQRFYFDPEKPLHLVFPSINLTSFLGARHSMSCAKLLGGKTYKDLGMALQGFVSHRTEYIPITRGGKQIKYEGFGVNGITKHHGPPRLSGGIVSDTTPRPRIKAPWELEFDIECSNNDYFDVDFLQKAFVRGGLYIGLGTYRGVFGKFIVDKWTVREMKDQTLKGISIVEDEKKEEVKPKKAKKRVGAALRSLAITAACLVSSLWKG